MEAGHWIVYTSKGAGSRVSKSWQSIGSFSQLGVEKTSPKGCQNSKLGATRGQAAGCCAAARAQKWRVRSSAAAVMGACWMDSVKGKVGPQALDKEQSLSAQEEEDKAELLAEGLSVLRKILEVCKVLIAEAHLVVSPRFFT